MPDTSYFIGLMSGTSLDAVDAVIVDFNQETPHIHSSYSHPIPSKLRSNILSVINPNWTGSLAQIGTLHQQLGSLFTDSVNLLLEKSSLTKNNIKAIGSHGQTLWHQPEGKHPFSMQLGDANLIAELTGIATVADFRGRDIAAGGQGAPLVPAFHHQILSHPTKNRIILNIGGIANISYLPSNTNKKVVMGFDTGPGNGLLDAWISKHKNINYDKNGEWGKSGSIISAVLDSLLEDPYFSQSAPKSTGKEAFNLQWLEETLEGSLQSYKPEDIQCSLVELTALTITNSINNTCDELFICGGGIHNSFLIERIKTHAPSIPVKSTRMLGLDPDWMEATAFAWLAKQTMEGKPGNLPITTGAKGSRVLGAIYPA